MKITTKFTPGPWSLGRPELKGSDAHMCEVMTAYTTKDKGALMASHDIICKTWSPDHLAASIRIDRVTCFYNATLIASAPTLYVACDNAASLMEEVAKEIGARGLADLSDDLRLEAKTLRNHLAVARGEHWNRSEPR
jgi:hypothetical protein